MGQTASRCRVAYGASKAGLSHLTNQVAVELAKHDIRRNSIARDPVKAPLVKLHPPEQVEQYLKTMPQRRHAETEEIAEAACIFSQF